jgi:AP2 domain.
MFQQTGTRSRRESAALWNAKNAGKPVGHLISTGYYYTTIFTRAFPVHRIVWKLAHGTDPEQIDHINRSRTDNRLANLRNIVAAENALNRSRRRDNRSGTPGVHWNNRRGQWVARIRIRKREYLLGYFHDLTSAVTARKAAELRLETTPRAL